MFKNSIPAFYCVMLFACFIQATPAQKKFEHERKELMEKINTINQIIGETTLKKKVSMGQVAALTKKIETNKLLINSLNKEISLINKKLSLQLCKIKRLETDLVNLKKEYASILLVGEKTMHNINALVFVLSADCFHTMLHRLGISKQYIKIRKTHFEEIKKVKHALGIEKNNLETQIARKKNLLIIKQKEQVNMFQLETKHKQIILALDKKHKQLEKELNQQKNAINQLDKLIKDIVAKELIAQANYLKAQQDKLKSNEIEEVPLTIKLNPKDKELNIQFSNNKGKMPWPVKTGFISHKFGINLHGVLKNVQVENLGIDIQTAANATAYAIAPGIVKTIAVVPGMHHVIIIQHGYYHSVFAKLTKVNVKVGQTVEAQTPLGIIYTDKTGICELQLQIWKGMQKLNPALWLSKQPN